MENVQQGSPRPARIPDARQGEGDRGSRQANGQLWVGCRTAPAPKSLGLRNGTRNKTGCIEPNGYGSVPASA
eukprot:10292956-Alexandrium_andersonii.AAC.1